METLQQWRRTPAVSSGLWSKRLIPQSHGSIGAKRLQNTLNSLSTASLGGRQGAKTRQKEAPTAANKMQVLDAASFTCDGAFPSHAEKKTNQKKVEERVKMLKQRVVVSDPWLTLSPLTQHRSLFPGNESAASSLSPLQSSCCASLNIKVL